MNHGSSELKADDASHLSSRLLGSHLCQGRLMLDRVIDAPAQQGRTYLDQALAQAVWEGKLKPPSPGLYD